MNIGIDIRAIGKNRTGDEVYTLQLVLALLAKDKENNYFLFTNTEAKNEIDLIKNKLKLEAEQTRVKIISVMPSSKMWWTFFLLPSKCREYKIDVLHVQYITPLFGLGKTKVVTTVHDVSFESFPEHIKWSDLLFLKILIPLSLRKATRIISVSDFTKKEIIKYYDTESQKIVSIANGGAAEIFFTSFPKEALDKVKAKYALPENFALYVGTLQPRKNIPALLRAFCNLKKEFYDHEEDKEVGDICLVIAGNKKAHNYDKKIDQVYAEIEKEVPEVAKQIYFPGFIADEDLPMLYKSALFFCFPSLYEGFGLPIIEAMASGVPVAYNDSSCLPEVAKEAALILEVDSLMYFSEKLFALTKSESKREELINLGHKRAREFSWDKCAEKTLEVYYQVFQG